MHNTQNEKNRDKEKHIREPQIAQFGWSIQVYILSQLSFIQ